MNSLELSIAWRYLRSRRGSKLLSFISVIAIVGVVVGVSALIVVMGVMNGLQRDLREKILIGSPDIRVSELRRGHADRRLAVRVEEGRGAAWRRRRGTIRHDSVPGECRALVHGGRLRGWPSTADARHGGSDGHSKAGDDRRLSVRKLRWCWAWHCTREARRRPVECVCWRYGDARMSWQRRDQCGDRSACPAHHALSRSRECSTRACTSTTTRTCMSHFRCRRSSPGWEPA